MTDHTTAEQKAREMLERIGVDDASSFSAGDVVELANLIEAFEQARDELATEKHARYRADMAAEAEARHADRLREELENEQARGIHSCHPNCTRDGCVNRRLRGMLSEALDQFEDYGDHGFWRVPASLMGRIREELGDE